MLQGAIIFTTVTALAAWRDVRNKKRIIGELPYLNDMLSDAQTCVVVASDERHMSVRSSEREIHAQMVRETTATIEHRERWLATSPFKRAFIFAPPNARDTMNYVMWNVFYYDDGDFYESYNAFTDRHAK